MPPPAGEDSVYDAPTRVGALRQPDIQSLFALVEGCATDVARPPSSAPPAERCLTESGMRPIVHGDDDADDDDDDIRVLGDPRTGPGGTKILPAAVPPVSPRASSIGLVRLESMTSVTSISKITSSYSSLRITVLENPASPRRRFGVAEAVIAASAGVILFAIGLVAYAVVL